MDFLCCYNSFFYFLADNVYVHRVAIALDASDPDFARSLRSLGPVQPSSTLSNSSTFKPSRGVPSPFSASQGSSSQPQARIFPDPSQNPALQVLTARERLQQEAEAEFSRVRLGGEGRRFLDVSTIREVLVLRDDKGMGEEEIEKQLGLKKGVVACLGGPRVVGNVGIGKVSAEDSAEDSGLYG